MSWAASETLVKTRVAKSQPQRFSIDNCELKRVICLLLEGNVGKREMAPLPGPSGKVGLRMSRIRHGRNVNAAVALEQTLMRDRKEWEFGIVILVVDFYTLGETGCRI